MNLVSGVGGRIKDLFAPKVEDRVADKPMKSAKKVDLSKTQIQRIKDMMNEYYKEASYEMMPLKRKWARNTLMLQGYQDLEWSDTANSWQTAADDYVDYAFPNNMYRSKITYGVALYVRNAPEFVFMPTSQDYRSLAAVEAARKALDVIKRHVGYNRMRANEALHLRLYGNALRYSYFSLDERFGVATLPQYETQPVQIDTGFWNCTVCGYAGEGNVEVCPNCGSDMIENAPPTTVEAQVPVAMIEYPRGQEVTEIVNPLEVYGRISCENLNSAPFLIRARRVDRIELKAMYGGDFQADATSTEDVSEHYRDMIGRTPGDPLDPTSWYGTMSENHSVVLKQGWFRPALYHDDPQLIEKFPNGMYAEVAGNRLLTTRDESMDDHWTHMPYNPVPGRFWGDGDDDLIPKQLQLNVFDQMILKNVAFNAVPMRFFSKTRVDVNKIENDPSAGIEVKEFNGQPISNAVHTEQGQSLSQETHVFREKILEDMDYHSGVFGSAIGEHQPGVNTFGGQQMMASRAEQNQAPVFLLYSEENARWATQVLKIASENWIDERVSSVMGLNGNWEFTHLKGALIQPDSFQIDARIVPADYAQQQAFSQAVASGVLNPQDPRVRRKALDLFGLSTELDAWSMFAKVQWKEIERMKEGEPVQAVPFRDNDAVHIEICQVWLNSDEADQSDPAIVKLVYDHLLEHIKNMQVTQMMLGGGEEEEEGAESNGQPTQQQRIDRQRRARKGQAAKPKTPQPSNGNQYGQ